MELSLSTMKIALRKIFLHSYEEQFLVYCVYNSAFKKEPNFCSVCSAKMLEIIPRKKKNFKNMEPKVGHVNL